MMLTEDCRRQCFRPFSSSLILILMCCAIMVVREANAINCIECSDKPMAPESSRVSQNGRRGGGISASDAVHGCSRLNPHVINYIRCSSDDDVCSKTVVYEAGLNEYGEKTHITRRRCSQLVTLLGNHDPTSTHDHEQVNHGHYKKTDFCWKDIGRHSPTYDVLICVCDTDFCNEASDGVFSNSKLLSFLCLLVVSLFYLLTLG